MSQSDKVISLLMKRGRTVKELRFQHGIRNPSAVVFNLRNQGYGVATVETRRGTFKYVL